MKKKTLAVAAMMALGGKAVAQNTQAPADDNLEAQFAAIMAQKKANEAEEKSLNKKIYENVLKYEKLYRDLQLGFDIKMLAGGDEAKAAKPQIKEYSMQLIDKRAWLILSYCPELKADNVEKFVDVLLNGANARNKFNESVKFPQNFWDADSETRFNISNNRLEFKDLVGGTYVSNQDILKEDFLNPQFLKKLEKESKLARADAMKSPDDIDKANKAAYLRYDAKTIKKLQDGISAAKKQGIDFNAEDLKNAVIANSLAHTAEINGYDRDNQDKRVIVSESQTKIKEAVKNMEMAGVTPQVYLYNRTTAANAENKTVSWDMAKAIAKNSSSQEQG